MKAVFPRIQNQIMPAISMRNKPEAVMKITIDYEASWRNSFLDGNNNEPIPKKGRGFIGSGQKLDKAENFIQRKITLDTVMGVLNRLIGDQRKLYQARQTENYFFKDLEDSIAYHDNPRINNHEVVYIRNMKGSTDQNSFTGAIKINDPIFTSEYSQSFWGVLALEFDELCDFIIDNTPLTKSIQGDPLTIIARLEQLNKEKPVADEGKVQKTRTILNTHFPDAQYLGNNEKVKPIMFYCSGLYLQMIRLERRFDMSTAKSKTGKITGISKRGFTKKNFMDRYTTGKMKRVWGGPYIRKEWVDGEGKVNLLLTKASGQLEINLEIEPDKAKELKTMIDSAGVSSFYLGKKGLAYVSRIRL